MKLTKQQICMLVFMTLLVVAVLAIARTKIATPERTLRAFVKATKSHNWSVVEPYIYSEDSRNMDSVKEEIEQNSRVNLIHIGGLVALDSGKAWAEFKESKGKMLISVHYRNAKDGFPTIDVIEMISFGNKYLIQNVDGSEQQRRRDRYMAWKMQCHDSLMAKGQSYPDWELARFTDIQDLAHRFNLSSKDTLDDWYEMWNR